MAIRLEPEMGLDIPDDVTYMDLRARAEAACRTAEKLQEHGVVVEPDDVDRETASTLVAAYAKNEEKTSKAVSNVRTRDMTPASLVETNRILKDYGHLVAKHAAEVRNTVVNKLIMETENPDARIRIRALELLGKMTDVGLFTDRKEITVTHKSADELREKLHEKLTVLKKTAGGVYEAEK